MKIFCIVYNFGDNKILLIFVDKNFLYRVSACKIARYLGNKMENKKNEILTTNSVVILIY